MRLIRKNITENITLVPLNTTSFSNLKYDNDNTKNDSVNKALLDDIQTAAKSVGIVATITTAKSGHNRLVKSGKSVSRHMNGTGVDVAILNGIGAGRATNATNGNPLFREMGNKLKDALVSMGYVWNTESGNPKAVLWQTNTGGNHFNHLHISNNTGLTSGEPNVSKYLSTGSSGNTYDSNYDYEEVEDAQTAQDKQWLKNIITQGLNLDKFKDFVVKGTVKEDIEAIIKLNQKMSKKKILNEELKTNDTIKNFTVISDKAGHAARPLGDWQSDSAWDLKAPIGTAVYSFTKGVVRKIRQSPPNNKKIFGTQVSITGEDGYSNIFYTHLEGVTLTVGSKVNVGDFIGKITKWPANPSGSHVHVGLQSGDLGDLAKGTSNMSNFDYSSTSTLSNDNEKEVDDVQTNQDKQWLKNIITQGLNLDKFKDFVVKGTVKEEINKIKKLL